MRLQRVFEQVFYRPWFITAAGHAAIVQLLRSKLAHGARPEVTASDDWLADFVNQRQPLRMEDGIAHIHVFGVLGQGLAPIEKSCGNTDYADIAADIKAAAGARGFVFHINSPGGMCTGCIETARLIAAIPAPKIAHTASMMCSAAYALAAGCDYIYATDSAIIGSIGTICPWIDSSGLWEKIGIQFQPIVSEGADLKSAMHGPSLTDEQRAAEQEMVDDMGRQFTDHVKAFRGPNPEVFRAGAYVGPRALEYGLIDAVMSEEDACATLAALTPAEQ